VRTVCAALVGFFPPVFGLLGTIWKDIFMLGALVLAVGLIVLFQRKKGIILALAIFSLLVVACSLRHNALVAIPPLVFWLVHSLRFVKARLRKWTLIRAVLLALAGSAVAYLCSSGLSSRLVSTNTCFWQVLAAYDITGISVRSNRVLFPPDCRILSRPPTLEQLRAVYSPYSVLPLYRGWVDDTGPKQPLFVRTVSKDALSNLSTLWLESVGRHPGAYLAHKWGAFSRLIGLTPEGVWSPYHAAKISENDFGFVFHRSVANDALTRWLEQLSKTHLYRPWVYIVILFVLSAVGVRAYLRTGIPVALGLSLSGLLYMLAYFPIALSPSFRYHVWGLLTAVLCVCYFICQSTTRLCKSPALEPGSPSAGNRVDEKERRFAAFPDSLREIDDRGKLLREWAMTFWAALPDANWLTGQLLRYYRITVPGEVPGRVMLGGDGSFLYFSGPKTVACFDPVADRWYGPVAVKDADRWRYHHGFAGPGGVWYGSGPLTYLCGKDIVAVADRAGLVFSSEQLKARLEERIAAARLFDQAKFAFSRHRFKQARSLLERALLDQPTNVEAVIVMGLLHERHALNRPSEALPYYQRAERVGKNAREALAGMYLQFLWHIRAGNRDRAVRLGREMLIRYELEGNCRARVLAALGKLTATAAAKKGSR